MWSQCSPSVVNPDMRRTPCLSRQTWASRGTSGTDLPPGLGSDRVSRSSSTPEKARTTRRPGVKPGAAKHPPGDLIVLARRLEDCPAVLRDGGLLTGTPFEQL